MVASLGTFPFHVGYTDELTSFTSIKSKGVTMTALLAKAVALIAETSTAECLLRAEFSTVLASILLWRWRWMTGGLITPVLQNADQVDIYSLSRNGRLLVDRARAKQLQPEEYNSGTFTLSNLGMFGVDRFDAILPPGQGSILAIGASRPQVVATSDGLMGCGNRCRLISPVTTELSTVPLLQLSCKIWEVD